MSALMKTTRTQSSVVIVSLCMFIFAGQSHAQKLNLQSLIKETQQTSSEPNTLTLIWWIPEQFWQASLGQDPTLTAPQIDQFLKTLRPYTVVAIVDGRVGAFGGVNYKKEDEIRASVTLKYVNGLSHAPLAESAIDADTKNLLQFMKPVLANMLGPVGQNTNFVLFPSKTEDGRTVVDASREGSLHIVLSGKEYRYRLPLASLLPPKYDSQTGESFPGNYYYNPFTGTKLVTDAPKSLPAAK